MLSGRDGEPSRCSLESRNCERTEPHGFSNKRRRVFVNPSCSALYQDGEGRRGGGGAHEDKNGDNLVVKSLSNSG